MGTGLAYDPRVETESARQESSAERLASSVYDAQAGSRKHILDGPRWLAIDA